MPSVQCTPSVATTAAPATKPMICVAWWVMLPMAAPTASLLGGRMSGRSAARAEKNGVPIKTVRNNSPETAHSGMSMNDHRPLAAIRPTVTIRIRSHAIITRRRGNRSARLESKGPPTMGGR